MVILIHGRKVFSRILRQIFVVCILVLFCAIANAETEGHSLLSRLKWWPNQLPADYYQKLQQLVASGQLELAKQNAEAIIKKYPDELDVRLLLAKIYIKEEKYSAVTEQTDYILQKNPRYDDAREVAISAALLTDNYQKAITLADQGLKNSPNSNFFLLKKAQAYAELQQYDPALAAVNQLLSSQPDNAAAIKLRDYLVSLQQKKQNNIPPNEYIKRELKTEVQDRAIKVTKRVPTLSPDYYQNLRQMLDRHQYSEVQQTAESILRNYPNESDVRLLLAKAYVAQRNYQAALEQAEYLLKQDSNNKDAYQIKKVVTRAMTVPLQEFIEKPMLLKEKGAENKIKVMEYPQILVLYNAGKKQQAKIEALKTIKVQVNEYDARLLLARIYSQEKNYSAASEQLIYILQHKPDYLDARLAFIDVEFATEQYQSAIETVEVGLKLHPNDPTLLYKQAVAYTELKQYKNAISILKTVVQLYPDNADARKLLKNLKDSNSILLNTPNLLGISENLYYASDNHQGWTYSSLFYARNTPLGTIGGGVNNGAKPGQDSVQYVVDVYPKLFKWAYLHLNYGRSNGVVYAHNQSIVEGYFNFPMEFDGSVGQRYIRYNNNRIYDYTAELGKNAGSYWISVRQHFFNPSNSLYYTTTLRRYFSNNANKFIGITVGTGREPDIADLSSGKFIILKAIGAWINGRTPITDTVFFDFGFGMDHQEFVNGNIRNLPTIAGSLSWHF